MAEKAREGGSATPKAAAPPRAAATPRTTTPMAKAGSRGGTSLNAQRRGPSRSPADGKESAEAAGADG